MTRVACLQWGSIRLTKLLVALLALIAGFVSASTVVGAETAVAANNIESAAAVEADANIPAGHVGSERAVFDDWSSGCCVAPSRTSFQVANSSRGTRPLTAAEAADARSYAQRLGMPSDKIRVSESMNTSYGTMFGDEVLYIGTDALPGAGRTANSQLSMRAAIAHEVTGHRGAAIAGRTRSAVWLEEAQASSRAAFMAPGLTMADRWMLIRDAGGRVMRR